MNWSPLDIVVFVVVTLLVAAAMEPWARVLHGRIWHRWLWRVHRSHHEPREGRFELNDALSFLHAPIAAGLVVWGCQLSGVWRAMTVGIGAGMTLFGVAYVLVHDGLVHERLSIPVLMRFRFFRRVRGAHLVHHRSGGVPYGLFLGPSELAQARPRNRLGSDEALNSNASSQRVRNLEQHRVTSTSSRS
jgi:beta-carotene 3-hydroxylase